MSAKILDLERLDNLNYKLQRHFTETSSSSFGINKIYKCNRGVAYKLSLVRGKNKMHSYTLHSLFLTRIETPLKGSSSPVKSQIVLTCTETQLKFYDSLGERLPIPWVVFCQTYYLFTNNIGSVVSVCYFKGWWTSNLDWFEKARSRVH